MACSFVCLVGDERAATRQYNSRFLIVIKHRRYMIYIFFILMRFYKINALLHRFNKYVLVLNE